jgi:hypothetical protein
MACRVAYRKKAVPRVWTKQAAPDNCEWVARANEPLGAQMSWDSLLDLSTPPRHESALQS